jgi:hypothetical protein
VVGEDGLRQFPDGEPAIAVYVDRFDDGLDGRLLE